MLNIYAALILLTDTSGMVIDADQPKVLLFPRDHSMFTECSPRGNAPAMAWYKRQDPTST